MATQLLLHCEGANGAQVFTDAKGLTTVTPYGAHIVTSTASPYFGETSAYLSGASDSYLTLTGNANLKPVGDFTFDCWFKTTSLAAAQTLFNFNVFSSGAGIKLTYYNGDIYPEIQGVGGSAVTCGIVTGTYYHIALIRSGSNVYLTLDGVLKATLSYAGGYSAWDRFTIAGSVANGAGVSPVRGYLDEIRFSDTALWTTFPFTPPTSAMGVYSVGAFSVGTLFGDPRREDRMIVGELQAGTVFGLPLAAYTLFQADSISSTVFADPASSSSFTPIDVVAWPYGFFPSPIFGHPARKVANDVDGFSSTTFGAPRAILHRRSGTPASIGPAASLGTPLATSFTTFFATSLSSTSFGVPAAKQPTHGTPASIASTSFGAPVFPRAAVYHDSISVLTRPASTTIKGYL